MSKFTDRMIGAAKLDAATYEEVEADQEAIGQAMAVVVFSSLAAGIGSLGFFGLGGLIRMTIAALVGWLVWAGLTYWIGAKLLPEPQTKADVGELLRTIGFASSPGILRILGFLPFFLGWLISFVASIWVLVATVVAVRQALDYKSTGRAVVVCGIGFVIQWIVLSAIMIVSGARSVLGGASMF